MSNAQENKPIKEILSDGEFIYFEWDYGDLEDYPEDCIVWVPKSAYLSLQAENEKLKEANKKLREGLEFYANKENWLRDKNGWRHDMIVEDLDDETLTDWEGRFSGKRARAALSEASEIEGAE